MKVAVRTLLEMSGTGKNSSLLTAEILRQLKLDLDVVTKTVVNQY